MGSVEIYFYRCPRGTGEHLTNSVTSVTDQFITKEQYTGSTGDGVYGHCGVPDRLDEHYSRTGVATWDKMHIAATQDTKMRNPKEEFNNKQKKFNWLNEITITISKAMKYVNWGKEWDHFFEVCKTMICEGYETKYRSPKMFSETKFANWVVVLYKDFYTVYPALLRTLEETKENLREGGEKEKAKNADELQGRILNLTFALSLSFLIDIYNIYSQISKLLQIVNILPFERFDKFEALLRTYVMMLDTVDHTKCSCFPCLSETFCLWPSYHTAIREVLSKGEFRKIPMGQLLPETTRTREGRKQSAENMLLDTDKVISGTNKRALDVVDFLYNGLNDVVYSSEERNVISHVRTLTDLKSVISKVAKFGAAQTSSLNWRRFLEAGKFFEPEFVCMYTADELRYMFREFYRRLEEMSKTVDMTKISSLDILGKFLSSNGQLSKDIEPVLGIIARAAVCTSVESIVESWVSIVEHHSPPTRVLSQDRLEDEAMVSINGPELVHADPVIKEALRTYWQGSKDKGNIGGHFIRRSKNIKSYGVSGAIDSIVKKPAKQAFMVV